MNSATNENFLIITSYRTDDPHPQLRDNPMALALPPPLSDSQLFMALRCLPDPRPEGFKELSLNERLERVKDIERLHLPFDEDLRLLRTAIEVVRASYISRNPNDPEVMRFITNCSQGFEGAVPRLSRAGGGGGLGILVSGPGGTGKTSASDRVFYVLDGRVRLHLTLNGKPCRWLQLTVIRVSVRATWKETLEAILLFIDSILGRDSLVRRERNATRPKLFKAVFQALSSGFAAILILDEFQSIKGLTRAAALEILNGIINLMENAGIPVMIVGTVAVRGLFERFPSQFSKFFNGGDIRFAPLARHSKSWSQFVTALQAYSVSRTPIIYSDSFQDDLHVYTMGIKRFAREYMKAIFTRHAINESLVVNVGMLDDISRNEMQGSQRAISVLRKAALNFGLDYATAQQYEDFLPPEVERVMTSASRDVQLKWLSANDINPLEPHPDLCAADFIRLEREVKKTFAREELEEAAISHSKDGARKELGTAGNLNVETTGGQGGADSGPALQPPERKRTKRAKRVADAAKDEIPWVDLLKLK